MTANDICLISPIEQNKDVVCWDGKIRRRYFEQEAIRMVNTWRQRAGWLKNIKVYFFNVNSAKISDDTKTQLLNSNCEIIDVQRGEYQDIGFLTEPLCGYEAEKTLSEKYLIKIDLDMQIVKPIGKEIIEMSNNGVLIEQYSDVDSKHQRDSIGKFNPFDTCFIISRRDSHFYEIYNRLCYSDEILKHPDWISISNERGMYDIEEFVVDYMFKNNKVNIIPMVNHLYGEGYVPIENRTLDEISDIIFLHSHIYMTDKSPDDNWCRTEKTQQQQYLRKICQVQLRK